jgi:hypothetical protein
MATGLREVKQLYVRESRATREKWRIPDRKVESGLFLYSELRMW